MSDKKQSSTSARAVPMWRSIKACCVLATVVLCGLLSGAKVQAQEVGQPPAPTEALAGYQAVDGWVRAWKVSADAKVPACIAASVILRLDGEVIGRGVVVDEKDRGGVVAAATKQALADAEPRLKVPRDALYEETVRDVAKRITISMQLAGDLIPISPRDAAEAAMEVAPGLEGVAARLGDRVAVMFPERMLIAGTEPGPALGSLVAKLGDDPTLAVEPLSKLAKERGVVFYRFRVTHLAQAGAGEQAVFLKRCVRVVPRAAMNEEELKRWADELARTLVDIPRLSQPHRGTFDPVAGVSEPQVATSQQALLSAISLASYLKLNDIEPSRRDQAQWRSVDFVKWVASHGEDKSDSATSALACIWQSERIPLETVNPGVEPQSAISFLLRSQAAVFEWERDPRLDEGLSNASLGLLAFSAVVSELPGAPAKPEHRQVFSKIPPAQLVSAMPWLGWSELRRHADGEVPTAVALRDMRDLIWKHQLQPEDLKPDEQDLAGGIVFTTSKQPMPTWQMARPLAFVATMLGDPRLTEDKEVAAELSRLLLSLRFLRQLTADDAECFMYRSAEKAKGGVRSSLWDQRMPPEATAMTLMTVCETLRSMEEIRKRREKETSR